MAEFETKVSVPGSPISHQSQLSDVRIETKSQLKDDNVPINQLQLQIENLLHRVYCLERQNIDSIQVKELILL